MTLLHAGLLTAGLVAAAIPILIHLLFRRRRPPIAWAAMDILLAALRKQERRLRLEQLVLLAVRCLLFALAGLALARPVLEGTGLLAPGARRTVTIVLDDGVASRVRTGDGRDPSSTAFARSKSDAAALARSLPPGDSVGVVLASRPARGLVVPPSTDREAVAKAIEGLEPSWAATDFAAALGVAAQHAQNAPGEESVVVVVSEFRAGSLDPTAPPPAAVAAAEQAPRIVLTPPASDDLADLAVTGIEAQRSIDEDSVTVSVRVERHGGSNPAQAVRVSLAGDGFATIPSKVVRFEAGQAAVTVEFVARAAQGAKADAGSLSASIEPDALPADDTRYAWFDPRGATRIGLVARRSLAAGGDIEQVPASRWLMRAIAPAEQPGIEVVEVEPAAVDARTLRDFEALVVPQPETLTPASWSAIRGFVDGGGLLVVMPAGEVGAQRWAEPFAAALGLPWQPEASATTLPKPLAFAPEQPSAATTGLFASIAAELPELLRPLEVTRTLPVRGATPSDVVLALEDGSPFLLAGTPPAARTADAGQATTASRGLVVLLTVAPELAWTNLPVKPFMVPLAQEVLRRGLARIGGADRAVVAEQPAIRLRDAAELVGPDDVRVGLEAGVARGPLLQPGAWKALDVAGRPVGGIAVNVDLAATRLAPQSPDVVSAWFAPAGAVHVAPPSGMVAALQPVEDSVGIAVWLLAAVALLAVVETLLARWFSHATSGVRVLSDPGVGAGSLVAKGVANGRSAA